MSDKQQEIILRPIGIVRSEIIEQTGEKRPENIAEIIVDEGLTESLENLEEFSHAIVLYWLHRSRRPAPKKVRPKGSPESRLVGVFATRSPDRPNPIGKATVKIVERRENVLRVQGLDAIDGSPVLDIKPYLPGYDSVEGARAPSWMVKR